MRSPLLGSLAAVLVAVLLEGAAGAVGTVAHSVVLYSVVPVPVGLLLALALSAVVHAGLVAAWPSRLVALAGVLGWGAAVFAGLATGPGGDHLVARPLDAVGAGWLLAGPVVLAVSTLAVRRIVLTPSPWPARPA